MAKMGRPKVENPANYHLGIRITEYDRERLEECCRLTNLSKADVIRLGIDLILRKYKK